MLQTWGDLDAPECFAHVGDPAKLPSALSLWEDLESVAAYAYHGAHGEAMNLRRDWFIEHDFPTYVAWWVEDGRTPTFAEASERVMRRMLVRRSFGQLPPLSTLRGVAGGIRGLRRGDWAARRRTRGLEIWKYSAGCCGGNDELETPAAAKAPV